MFCSLDRDGNGVLSVEEAGGKERHSVLHAQGSIGDS